MTLKMYYVPCPTTKTAQEIARALLENKKIGCANILPQMTSIYWWQDKIEQTDEVVLILKTHLEHTEVEQAVKQLHPYEIPAIIEIKVNSTNQEYLSWIKSSLE